jgi:outer membrane receptor protein involved in Fe transport
MKRPVFTVALLAASIRLALAAGQSDAPVEAPAPAQAAPTATTQAQGPGYVTGTITGSDGAPVSLAEIEITGTDIFVFTGEDGKYTSEVPAGTYTINIRAEGFADRSEPVTVSAQQIQTVDIALQPPAPGASDAGGSVAGEGEEGDRQLETVEVEDQAISEGSSEAVVLDRRYSPQVVEAISAEQISRAGDSDAATALKRVTGLTLVDNQFVYVRGLGERYSSVLLNGAQIPSPDPTRRVVPLDLFPTDVIDSITVQKSYSADMPAEFGGGTVLLRTKRVVDEFQMKASVSSEYLHGTTGEDGLTYRGGDRDWLGRDDGSREFPNGFTPFPTDPAAVEAIGEGVAAKGYETYERNIDPGAGFSFGIGDVFKTGEWSLGYVGAIRYAHEWDTRNETRRTFALQDNGGLTPSSDIDRYRTERMVDTSALVGLGAEYGNNHSVGATFLQLRQSTDETRIDEGWDTNPSDIERKYLLEFIENELLVKQFSGTHGFPEASYLQLDWQYTRSDASRFEPNTRDYEYVLVPATGDFTFSRNSGNNNQRFAQLDDQSDELRVDAQLPIDISDNLSAIFLAGGGRIDRERDSFVRKFQFRGSRPVNGPGGIEDVLVPELIGPGGLQITETTLGTDAYRADQTLDALYLATDLTLAERYRLNLGVRREANEQRVETFPLFNPGATPIVANIDESDILPSATFTWMYSDDAQLRFGYSKSLSRPDFRELSPAQFTDPVLDVTTRGNPDLVQSEITHYDARWEYYFSDTETFSAALFLKDFQTPIEKVRVAGTGELLELRNAREATNYGIELDYFNRLSWLERWSTFDDGWLGGVPWADIYFGLNYAWIDSEVSLGDVGGIQTTDDRPLQGQSPYVANVQIGYARPDGSFEATLLYNLFGKRISEVGIQGNPDIYEQPVDQLDFVVGYRFADQWKMKLRARNLLDPSVEYTQGDEIAREYRRGREFSLSLEWTW